MAQTIDLTKGLTDFVSALTYSHSDIGKREIGLPVMRAVQNHFLALNNARHHAWAPGKGFYADAAKNTEMNVLPDGVEIVTDRPGLRLRIEGGVVKPGKNPSCITGKPTKYLSIPAIAEAYGRGACTFGGLRFVKFGKADDAPAALVEANPQGAFNLSNGKKPRVKGIKNVKQQGAFSHRVFYWLVKQTTHKPDPTVEPDIEELTEIGMKSMADYNAKFLK